MEADERAIGEIDVARSYQSEVSDRRTGLGVRLTVLPAVALMDPGILDHPGEVLNALDLSAVSEPLSAEELAPAISSVLLRDNDAEAASEHLGLVLQYPAEFAADHEQVLAFSEYVAHASVVPIEHSPVSVDSLVSILGGSGAGVGVGIMVAGGPTPLLLLTVPAGIILVGAATGIADGLGDGLRYRIKRLFGVPPEPPPEAG